MILTHSQLKEWNDFYPCPSEIVRLALKLTNPTKNVENRDALGHDFFYLSDEFSVIFHPLETKTDVHMLVEGPHMEPQGERIPILSTWTHLKRSRGDTIPGAIQHNFVFYKGKWWTAEFTYDYGDWKNNIDVIAYSPLYWCYCDSKVAWTTPPFRNDTYRNGHHVYPQYELYTIFKDKTRTEFSAIFDHVQEYFYDLPIFADWLEERSDSLAEYVREIANCTKDSRQVLPELAHMCRSIEVANNDRSARLLLLAQGIQKHYVKL